MHGVNSLVHLQFTEIYTDVLWEYLDYQVFMVRLTYVHAVDTRPFSRVGRGLGMRLRENVVHGAHFCVTKLSQLPSVKFSMFY